jgi:hypothetical protein
MLKGAQGQKRPRDPIQSAMMFARIATGEISETPKPKLAKLAKGGKKRPAKKS